VLAKCISKSWCAQPVRVENAYWSKVGGKAADNRRSSNEAGGHDFKLKLLSQMR
jgi:hypothetical protein